MWNALLGELDCKSKLKCTAPSCHTIYRRSSFQNSPYAMYTFDQGDAGDDSTSRYLISPENVRNALAHQYWVEGRLEEIENERSNSINASSSNARMRTSMNTSLRTSTHNQTRNANDETQQNGILHAMSFAESVLSIPVSTASVSASVSSVSTVESLASSVFSALTSIVSNGNKYGIPLTPSPARRRKKRGALSSRDRYKVHIPEKYKYTNEDDDGDDDMRNNDWDYQMDVKMTETETVEAKPMPKRAAPRESYVLHLKTIAHMSDFYRDEFLLSFPQYPVPKEMATRKVSFQSNWTNTKREPWNPPSIIRTGGSPSSSVSLEHVHAHHAHAQTQLSPEGFSPIQLAVDDSSFMDIGIFGSLGLATSRTHLSQLSSIYNKRKSAKKHFIVLGYWRKNKPLMVCSLKSRKGKPVVRIFATKPRIPLQESSIDTKQIGITAEALPLYTWAELKTQGEFPDADSKYYWHTCTGVKNQFHEVPLYTATHPSEGVSELNFFGRKEDGDLKAVGDPFHCARVCVRSEVKMCEQETNYMISIVKGVEFANILAMVAIIDELIEFSMKKKCAMLAWKFTNTV